MAGFLIGIISFFFLVALASAIDRYFFKKSRKRFASNLDHPVRYSTATIARDLVPHVATLDLSDAQITILGVDAAYLGDRLKGSYFASGLEMWVKGGATIRYLLLDESSCDPRSLIDLKGRLGDSLEVLFFNRQDCTPEALEIADRFEHLHPTLIDLSGSKKAFWVEYDHPRGSTIAYDAKFVSPVAIADELEENEYLTYQRQLDVLIEFCNPMPVFKAAA